MTANVFRKTYRPLTDEEKKSLEDIKDAAQVLHDLISAHESGGKMGREVALAKTKLEESVMWIVKGITG